MGGWWHCLHVALWKHVCMLFMAQWIMAITSGMVVPLTVTLLNIKSLVCLLSSVFKDDTMFCHMQDTFPRMIMINTNWQQRSAMSFVIRWVAILFCSQGCSLNRSLIMEKAAGNYPVQLQNAAGNSSGESSHSQPVPSLTALNAAVSSAWRSINQLSSFRWDAIYS